MCRLREVSNRILDGNDIFISIDDGLDRLRLDIGTGPAGHIVHNDRKLGFSGNHAVMLDEALLGCLVIIRSND